MSNLPKVLPSIKAYESSPLQIRLDMYEGFVNPGVTAEIYFSGAKKYEVLGVYDSGLNRVTISFTAEQIQQMPLIADCRIRYGTNKYPFRVQIKPSSEGSSDGVIGYNIQQSGDSYTVIEVVDLDLVKDQVSIGEVQALIATAKAEEARQGAATAIEKANESFTGAATSTEKALEASNARDAAIQARTDATTANAAAQQAKTDALQALQTATTQAGIATTGATTATTQAGTATTKATEAAGSAAAALASQNMIGAYKGRDRTSIRKASNGFMYKYPLPSAFSWADAYINVYTDGLGNYYTDFDAAKFKNVSSKTIYCDTVNGLSSNDGLTEATPCQSLKKAYDLAASGDTIMIINKGVIYRSGGWQNQRLQKSLNVIAKYPGEVKIVYADSLTYTLAAGQTKTYQTTRSSVMKVIDSRIGKYGIQYSKVTSIAECESTPGSWFQSGSTLYVRTFDGSIPDNRYVYALLAGEAFWCNNDTQAITIYLEGLQIWGGNTGNWTLDKNNATNAVIGIGKNCDFLWSTVYSGLGDAINADGIDLFLAQNCTAMYSTKDGFNYTSYNNASQLRTSPKVIEVNCTGANNGLENGIAGSENTNNGSTLHEGAMAVRIGGQYYGNKGANVADVQVGTKSVNIACNSYDSKAGTANAFDSNYSAQQAGAEMWVIDCIGFGAAYDVYAVSGTIMHIWNTQFDTKQGGGLYDIVNQL